VKGIFFVGHIKHLAYCGYNPACVKKVKKITKSNRHPVELLTRAALRGLSALEHFTLEMLCKDLPKSSQRDGRGRVLLAVKRPSQALFALEQINNDQQQHKSRQKTVQTPVPAVKQADKSHIDETEENLKVNFLPGIKPVLELLQNAPERIDCVFIRKGRRDNLSSTIIDLCRERKVRFNLLEDSVFLRLYKGNSQSVLARLFEAGFSPLEDLLTLAKNAHQDSQKNGQKSECLPVLVALDQVVDPGNVGTLARTIYALGGAGLIIARHQGAFLGPTALKAAAGALQKLPVSKVTNLAQALDKAEQEGFNIYGASAESAAVNVFDFVPELPAILVLGSEESGMRQGIAKRCSTLLRIPMYRDFNSLNVAQAGAIILAQFLAK
jgi:23S rRNA (guanosine2251-2'-O)-methyltransferase